MTAVEQASPDAGAPPSPAPDTAPSPDVAPSSPDTSLDEVESKLQHISLARMAEYDDYPDDYGNERRDQEALKRNDPAFNDPQRQQERAQRHQRLLERLRDDQAKSDAADPRSEAIEARIKDERTRAQAEVRIEQYERENPGFTEFVTQTVETYGDVSPEAAKAIFGSPRGPEIIDRICQNPEAIEALNKLPSREMDLFVAKMEGLLEGMGHAAPLPAPQPQARRISSAPPPVSTVTGKAHAASKSLEDMDYDEYRKTRMAQIQAKRERRA